MYNYNPNLLLEDHAIPRFLRIPQTQRKAAWERNATQIAYQESITRDKAAQRAKDEVRWAELKARKAAEKAELALVAVAVKRARCKP